MNNYTYNYTRVHLCTLCVIKITLMIKEKYTKEIKFKTQTGVSVYLVYI
jgi:hypothetical protein